MTGLDDDHSTVAVGLPPPPLPTQALAGAPCASPLRPAPPDVAWDEPAPAKRPGGFPAIVVALGVVAVFVAAWAIRPASTGAAGWGADFEAGLRQAQASGKPLVVLFTADWCPAFREFESGALSQAEVVAYLGQNFTPVKVDLSDRSDAAAGLAQQFNVSSIPTIVAHDMKGFEVNRTHGMDGPELVAWLERARRK